MGRRWDKFLDGVERANARLGRVLAWGAVASVLGLSLVHGLLFAAKQQADGCLAGGALSGEGEACKRAETLLSWLDVSARWTQPRDLREELATHRAERAYLGALFDGAALDQARQNASQVYERIQTGSGRIEMQAFGERIGAPRPARLAIRYGDREWLKQLEPGTLTWSERARRLYAHLHDGEVSLAIDAARTFAVDDPRNDDLRMLVAATLCISADAEDRKRGLSLLPYLESDRATRVYANIHRDFGDVRVIQAACARTVNAPAPPPPEDPPAGRNTLEAAQVLEQIATQPQNEALKRHAIGLAEKPETDCSDRAFLLAAGTSTLRDEQDVAREENLLDGCAFSETIIESVLERRLAPRGEVDPKALEALAIRHHGPSHRFVVELAMRAWLRRGSPAEALRFLNVDARQSKVNADALALFRGLTHALALDLDSARRELESAQSFPLDLGHHHEIRLEAALLLAELGGQAPELPQKVTTLMRTRRTWLGGHQIPGAPTGTASLIRPLPWVGYATPEPTWNVEAEMESARLFHATCRGGSRSREFQHALLALQGDAPPVLLGHMRVVRCIGGLSPEGFLDAVYALDEPRFSLRAMVWSRAMASTLNGDMGAAQRHRAAFAALQMLSAQAPSALIDYLGI